MFVALSVCGQKESDVTNSKKCYESHLKKGDELYASLQYYEAAAKYEEALKCGYEPVNSNL